MAGIPSKLSDCDWVKYVEQSDFVTLVKPLLTTLDMSVFWFFWVFLVIMSNSSVQLSSCHTKGDDQEVLS